MAKFCGAVGYAVTTETSPGVWTNTIVEHTHYGDILTLKSKWQESSDQNDNLRIGNSISILADEFAYTNFSSMKYVVLMGIKWKITDVTVQRPRLILTLGGEWNG